MGRDGTREAGQGETTADGTAADGTRTVAVETAADRTVMVDETGMALDRTVETGTAGALFLKGSPLIQKTSPIQILGGPVFEAHLELLKIISSMYVFSGWRSMIYRFCKLWTSQACLPIPSCRFTTLLQRRSIVFLDINKSNLMV